MAASTGPAHGTNTRPRLRPSTNPPPSDIGRPAASPTKGRSNSSPTAGTSSPTPSDAEDHDADPAQEIRAGGPVRDRSQVADQGGHREAEHQTRHHGEGTPPPAGRLVTGPPGGIVRGPGGGIGGCGGTVVRRRPAPGGAHGRPAPGPGSAAAGPVLGDVVVESAGRARSEDHRQDRQDARGDPGHQSPEEAHDEEHDHRDSLARVGPPQGCGRAPGPPSGDGGDGRGGTGRRGSTCSCPPCRPACYTPGCTGSGRGPVSPVPPPGSGRPRAGGRIDPAGRPRRPGPHSPGVVRRVTATPGSSRATASAPRAGWASTSSARGTWRSSESRTSPPTRCGPGGTASPAPPATRPGRRRPPTSRWPRPASAPRRRPRWPTARTARPAPVGTGRRSRSRGSLSSWRSRL